MATPSDGVSGKIITPDEMAAQAALNRIKAICDKAYPSYMLVVGDHRIPFGGVVDRDGVWVQVLANIMVQNPLLRRAVILACLDADRQAVEWEQARLSVLREEALAADLRAQEAKEAGDDPERTV